MGTVKNIVMCSSRDDMIINKPETLNKPDWKQFNIIVVTINKKQHNYKVTNKEELSPTCTVI